MTNTIEVCAKAGDRAHALAYIDAVKAAAPNMQCVTQDDWGKTYDNGYCFNMRFASAQDASAADAIAAERGVVFVDPAQIETRDNVWA